MRMLCRVVMVLLFTLVLVRCGDDESNPNQDLPQACSARGVYAIGVLQTNYTCLPTNAFMNADDALDAPDAASTGTGRLQYTGFTSLGVDGSITLYMGSCIQDLPGDDLRVFQSVSREALEVQVSQSQEGPFISLGVKECIDPFPFFVGSCSFDLAGSGLNNVRVVKIIDREKLFFPGAACDNAGPHPGADIDAIEVLHPGT
jgi:hypothetical protein